jgi:hypothetical protein
MYAGKSFQTDLVILGVVSGHGKYGRKRFRPPPWSMTNNDVHPIGGTIFKPINWAYETDIDV